MTFYQSCMGGELTFQTIGESPLSGSMPEEMKAPVLHATLKHENFELLATDMTPDEGLKPGNNMHVFMLIYKETIFNSILNGLSTEAIEVKSGYTDHKGRYANLIDKFHINWLLFWIQPPPSSTD